MFTESILTRIVPGHPQFFGKMGGSDYDLAVVEGMNQVEKGLQCIVTGISSMYQTHPDYQELPGAKKIARLLSGIIYKNPSPYRSRTLDFFVNQTVMLAEQVDKDVGPLLYRARVPGRWLVVLASAGRVFLRFVRIMK